MRTRIVIERRRGIDVRANLHHGGIVSEIDRTRRRAHGIAATGAHIPDEGAREGRALVDAEIIDADAAVHGVVASTFADAIRNYILRNQNHRARRTSRRLSLLQNSL